MRPLHTLSLLGLTALLSSSLLACQTNSPTSDESTDAGCRGDDCGIVLDTGDDGDIGFPDVNADATADGADGDAQMSCDAAVANACGGCSELPVEPDQPCGECGRGQWTCLGLDEIVCEGDPGPASWRPDRDGDGYGDDLTTPVSACEPPDDGLDYVGEGGDCDDFDPAVNPDGTEACNGDDDDCDELVDEPPGDDSACADACCDDELVCEAGRCLIPCATIRCGESLDQCCAEGDLCFAGSCTTPADPCEYTEDCPVDYICEPSLGACIPREVVPVCEFIPPVGEFSPRLSCRWTAAGLEVDPLRDDVVGTPVVLNLTDDNDDGLTNRFDTPDIAFLTYDYENDGCCNHRATVRVVSGLCNDDGTDTEPATMVTLASINQPALNNDTGIAAGDLTGDGVPELVAVGFWGRSGDDRPQGTIAFERLSPDGTSWGELWRNTDYPTWNVHTRGGATLAIADLNHDGDPEVVVGNVALNGQTGELLWDGLDSAEDGEQAGIGNNAFLGPASTVADVDGDSFMEVIAGNTLYSWDGDIIAWYDYTTDNSDCDGSLPCDGFNGVGNFDEDDEAEIVIVRLGQVFILEHDMTLKWMVDVPADNCAYNESGPPTVADFDGDGRPEVGTAGADYYVVVDMDCDPNLGPVQEGCDEDDVGVLWKVVNQDCSSRATASSVFDFEGDGAAEVIYADETSFRIFDGSTGVILYDDPTHGSHTRIEMPVIADVDDDGNAEVIIPENGYGNGQPGIDVWEDGDDNWVRTRRIWNQHSYHVTNVTEDGAIPELEEPNWLNGRLNNFRQNVQPAGLFDAPDLVVRAVVADGDFCHFEVDVTVANEGALSVPAGALVRVELLVGEAVVASADAATATRLFPGESEIVTIPIDRPESGGVAFTVRASIDPDGAINECDEEDNVLDVDGVLDCGPK